MIALVLGWRPFLDPLDAHGWWFVLLVPLALGISIAYRAVRLPALDRFWWRVAIMTAQIVGAITGLAIASYVVIQVLIPLLTPMPE